MQWKQIEDLARPPSVALNSVVFLFGGLLFLIVNVALGVAMLHRGIGRSPRFVSRPNRYGAVEAARVGCDVPRWTFVPCANSGALAPYAVFMLGLQVTRIGPIASFDSAIVLSHAR
jgi:hypothetical protein